MTDKLTPEQAAALAAQLEKQPYIYIGKDGRPVLARDLEDQLDLAVTQIAELEEALTLAKAERTKPRVDEWQPMETAPDDVWHLRGLWRGTGKSSFFEYFRGMICDDTGEFVNEYGEDFGWSQGDYSHWHPDLPEPPRVSGGEKKQ